MEKPNSDLEIKTEGWKQINYLDPIKHGVLNARKIAPEISARSLSKRVEPGNLSDQDIKAAMS